MEKYAVHCGNCRKKLTFGARLLGKAVDCPNCKAVIAIPLSLKPVPPKHEAVAVHGGAPIPTFQAVPKAGDSIFDAPPPVSVLDAPPPKPVLPPEPLPPTNPFAFDEGIEASPSVEITAEANPFGFVEANAHVETAKAKPASKPGRLRPGIEPDNPFGAAETVTDARAEAVPETHVTATKPYGQPKQAQAKVPPITWLFLVWALLATGAAIFFAMKKPAPVTTAPVQEKSAGVKKPERKEEKSQEKKVERKMEKKADKKGDTEAERKEGKSAMEKDEMKK